MMYLVYGHHFWGLRYRQRFPFIEEKDFFLVPIASQEHLARTFSDRTAEWRVQVQLPAKRTKFSVSSSAPFSSFSLHTSAAKARSFAQLLYSHIHFGPIVCAMLADIRHRTHKALNA